MAKRVMAIDIESYSSVDLLKCGVYKYVESEDFEILLFGYAFDDEAINVIDLTEDGILPDDIINALTDENILKTAFNAAFERICLQKFLGMVLPIEQWQCTAVLSRELGLPGSLAAVGEVLGLAEDKQKSKTGKALIQYFSKPCKPTKVNGNRTRNLPSHDKEKWQQYIEYNRQDVEAERAIRKKLLRFNIHKNEQKLWITDQQINDRGVKVDTVLADNAIEIDTVVKAELLEKAKELSGLDNPKSVAQLKDWIESETGVIVDTLEKKAMPGVLASVKDSKAVTDMLTIRKGLSKTSIEKYKAMLRCANNDDRARGLTMFYGASRTGRWAGRIVQMQNLPQNKMPDKDLDLARQLVYDGDIDTLDLLFANPADVLSQLIRTAFIPERGKTFVVADFSAIEARVIAWLAGEQWRLDVFNTHGKIYEASAEQMFHLKPGSVGKGDSMRQKGKIAELALGYGGAVGALKSMGALEMGLAEEELQPLVKSWRAANNSITKFWWDTDKAARRTIATGGPAQLQYGLTFYKDGPLMRLKLPNGRSLSYVKPGIDREDNITYEGTIQTSGCWGRIESYGPKFVENIVQATARDCLADTIMKAEKAGLPVIFHVHDELICEVPEKEAGGALKILLDIMAEPPTWAKGLPIKGDGYICEYYRKA